MSGVSTIGILDSGVGGLSVVRAIRELLPDQSIVYCADTAYFPYGLKSAELIRKRAVYVGEMMARESGCSLLVIACHTMSALCLDLIQQRVSCPVIGMIDPAINGLKRFVDQQNPKTIGIISTRATQVSGVYRKSWPKISRDGATELYEYSLSSIVGIIEEGLIKGRELDAVVDALLPEKFKRSDALLLGCTHFYGIIPSLQGILSPTTAIVDAATLVAEEIAIKFRSKLEREFSEQSPSFRVMVSDNPERFLQAAIHFGNFVIDDICVFT